MHDKVQPAKLASIAIQAWLALLILMIIEWTPAIASEKGKVSIESLSLNRSVAYLGEEIAAMIGGSAINLCGQTTLRQAMALIGCCHLFITNDSGLMHVAAALDIPQVALIGPTDPLSTGPSNPASVMLRMQGACPLMPCMKPHCPQAHQCMTAISVDNAFNTAIALFNNREAN